MILKGSQRAGATAMGLHLLRQDDNDHVEVHEIRGFVARNVVDALREVYAISRGTRCKQFIFSLSLSPPEGEIVPNSVFERAIENAEQSLGLTGQPRVIVFHEKNGRRHAHCVWSRINGQAMKAINLPHYKLRLREASRQLYMEHGWRMPKGLAGGERDPFQLSREEWQQAVRAKRDPVALKKTFRDCWAISDNAKSFAQALQSRGLYLASGDRRAIVAVDWRGAIYSVSRWVEVPTKHVVNRIGDMKLSGIDHVLRDLSNRISSRFGEFAEAAAGAHSTERARLWKERERLVSVQRAERARLRAGLEDGLAKVKRECAARFRRGLGGLWDWISGASRRIAKENADALTAALAQGEAERERLRTRHLDERRQLQMRIRAENNRHHQDVRLLDAERTTATAGFKSLQPGEVGIEQRRTRKRTPQPDT